jgi:hypothetical protein
MKLTFHLSSRRYDPVSGSCSRIPMTARVFRCCPHGLPIVLTNRRHRRVERHVRPKHVSVTCARDLMNRLLPQASTAAALSRSRPPRPAAVDDERQRRTPAARARGRTCEMRPPPLLQPPAQGTGGPWRERANPARSRSWTTPSVSKPLTTTTLRQAAAEACGAHRAAPPIEMPHSPAARWA